jgi:hypothetical protein
VLFQDVLDRFVQPEVAARHIAGELLTDTAIYRLQVLIHPEGEPEVRLNEQVGGVVEAVATRTIEPGGEVTTDDFSGVSSYELRGAGRYLDKGLALKDGEPNTLFDLLADMEAHVTRVTHGEETDDETQGFTVIAKRDVRAGQLVTQDDFTLRPPKSP